MLFISMHGVQLGLLELHIMYAYVRTVYLSMQTVVVNQAVFFKGNIVSWLFSGWALPVQANRASEEPLS